MANDTAGEWIEEPIKVAIKGYTYKGLFAVHPHLVDYDRFVITHLPSGYSMGVSYETLEETKEAAVRVYRAYVGWESVTADDVKKMSRETKLIIRDALGFDEHVGVR